MPDPSDGHRWVGEIGKGFLLTLTCLVSLLLRVL